MRLRAFADEDDYASDMRGASSVQIILGPIPTVWTSEAGFRAVTSGRFHLHEATPAVNTSQPGMSECAPYHLTWRVTNPARQGL
jgi:hypothetical protein